MNNQTSNLIDDKTSDEILFTHEANHNREIYQILSNFSSLNETNLPYNVNEILKEPKHRLNCIQHANCFYENLISCLSNHAHQKASNLSSSITALKRKPCISTSTSARLRKRRRLTSVSNDEINLFDKGNNIVHSNVHY